jgi:hypothetical protein
MSTLESAAPLHAVPTTAASSAAAAAAAPAPAPRRPPFRAFTEGMQSVHRLGTALQAAVGGGAPLFELCQTHSEVQRAAEAAAPGEPAVHLLWENTAKSFNQSLRAGCLAYNHLANAGILEDKADLARLQELMPCPTLKSYVVRGRREFLALADRILLPAMESPSTTAVESATMGPSGAGPGALGGDGGDTATTAPVRHHVWVVKDPLANSAEGVWFFTRKNLLEVAAHLHDEQEDDLERSTTRMTASAKTGSGGSSSSSSSSSRRAKSAGRPHSGYAVQRFVANPALFNGRKYHIRTYNLILGDMSAFIHHQAFLHVANKPYALAAAVVGGDIDGGVVRPGISDLFDQEVFLTNCCANKGSEAFAGEICIDLQSAEWALVFAGMQVRVVDTHRHIHTHRHTHTYTYTHKHTQTDTHTQTQTHKHTHTHCTHAYTDTRARADTAERARGSTSCLVALGDA